MKYAFTLLAFALMSSGLAQIPEYVSTDGLVAWYPFSGDASDLSEFGNDGSVQGPSLTTDRFGNASCAYGFDGVDDYILIEGSDALEFEDGDFTFSGWFKTSVSKRQWVVSNYLTYGNNPLWMLGIPHNGTLNSIGYDVRDGINQIGENITNSEVVDGFWHHSVFVRSGNSIELYLDGVSIYSLEVSNLSALTEGNPYYIGTDNLNFQCWEGAIDDVGFWNRGLTVEEIIALHSWSPFGCTDPEACNYSAEATFEDGSCFLPGCMDTNACNFDEAATCPSDGCIYFPVVDLGEDLIVCEESVILAAGNEGASYLWSTGETTSAIDVTQSGGYSVGVSVSSGLPADAVAIDGFQHIGSFEQSHYYVSEASILWEEAKINCELLGGHLVTISSEEENELVWQGVYANGLNPGGSNNYQAWIGLYQNFDSPDYSEPAGGWEWVTGEPVVYSNWAPEEPNNNDQGYFVHMTDANGACTEGDDICGTWDDANISGNLQSAFYVLELPIVSTLCTSSDSVFVEFNHGSCFCGANAVWDESLGECVGEISPSSACGPGTYWDEQGQECIILVPSDTDFDGCVSMVDLLDLLTVFGTCVEVPWACGYLLDYQGYDYETVQIGEQCWFAENLRSENYENGDAIPSGLSGSEWENTSSGAVAVYNEDASLLETYGRLYNWYAVDDARGLCPSGWHVPTDGEWTMLSDHLGGESVAGGQMKTDYGWNSGGNGTNSTGFSALPGGKRRGVGGASFYSVGAIGYWWSSSQVNESRAFIRAMYDYNDEVLAGDADFPEGYSVRCIQDSE